MRRFRTAQRNLVGVLSFVLLQGVSTAADRPRIELFLKAESCTNGSNITVEGAIRPALNVTVEYRFYHVKEDGGLVYQAGGHVVAPKGEFGPVGTSPPPGGWQPGTLRCVVFLNQMQHVRSSFDVKIAGQKLPPPQPIYEAKLSDIVVDADHPPVGGWTITAGERFLVKGTFGTPGLDGIQRPAVFVEIIDGAGGRRNEIIMEEAMTLGLSDDRRRCSFEVELTTPARQVGKYKLRVKVPAFLDDQVIYADLDDVPLNLTAPAEKERSMRDDD